MRSTTKKPDNSARRSSSTRSRDGKANSAGGRKLSKLGGKLGNETLGNRINDNNLKRDDLLQMISGRLENLHAVQQHEVAEMGHERKWFKEVAKGTEGFHLPDATRWHAAATLFKRAAEALAFGNLGRGAQLVDQALEAERAAMASTPQMVRDRFTIDERQTPTQDEQSAAIGEISVGASCDLTELPKATRFADLVLNVSDKMEQATPLKKTSTHDWWSELEEEEDEAAGAGA